MGKSSVWLYRFIMLFSVLLFALTPNIGAAQRDKNSGQLNAPADRNSRRMESLKEEVRHQLVMLPYYSVFDWLEAQVKPDGTVTLMGEVTRPSTKDDAEDRVKKLEAATKVVNNIEVLPLSPMDDQLRIALYRAIFRFDSPLFRYGTQSVPPIHIIVKNGHVTLRGIVANQMDSQLAYMAAQGVPNIFEVKNELQVEQRLDEKVSKK
jgi:hyperosmotically inducible periplasmic protein